MSTSQVVFRRMPSTVYLRQGLSLSTKVDQSVKPQGSSCSMSPVLGLQAHTSPCPVFHPDRSSCLRWQALTLTELSQLWALHFLSSFGITPKPSKKEARTETALLWGNQAWLPPALPMLSLDSFWILQSSAVMMKIKPRDAANTAEAWYSLYGLLYLSSLPLAKLVLSVNLEQETPWQPPTQGTRNPPPQSYLKESFFPLLNINKCLQLFQDCYVLLRYTQILSLQVKTVIPKSFPLGQINRFLCLVTKDAMAYCMA